MKFPMKNRWIAALIVIISATFVHAVEPQQGFDRRSFYKSMQSDSLDLINKALTRLEGLNFNGKQAYLGALKMKKAGLIKGAGAKLKMFKSGARQLETAIEADPENAEFRFLRLMIQEHAPKIVKYSNDISTDREIIVNSYQTFPSELQKAVRDYSLTSKTLDAKDL